MIVYAVLVAPAGNTGYELVTELYASGNTERAAEAAAGALARSYELEGNTVTTYRLTAAAARRVIERGLA